MLFDQAFCKKAITELAETAQRFMRFEEYHAGFTSFAGGTVAVAISV
jgi:hypothetical protein